MARVLVVPLSTTFFLFRLVGQNATDTRAIPLLSTRRGPQKTEPVNDYPRGLGYYAHVEVSRRGPGLPSTFSFVASRATLTDNAVGSPPSNPAVVLWFLPSMTGLWRTSGDRANTDK